MRLLVAGVVSLALGLQGRDLSQEGQRFLTEPSSVTVLEVKPSPDLKIATAYVRPLLNENPTELLTALNRHKRYIRGLLAPKLKLKFTPEIRFALDTVLDKAGRIDEILRDPTVARDLADKDGSSTA